MQTAGTAALSCRTDRTERGNATPLHHAAIEGKYEDAKCLLRYGAAADLKDAK